MAYDLKYGHVTVENPPQTGMDNEPVFLLRAQDLASVPTLLAYLQNSVDVGANDTHLTSVRDVIDTFQDWQADYSHRVKTPD